VALSAEADCRRSPARLPRPPHRPVPGANHQSQRTEHPPGSSARDESPHPRARGDGIEEILSSARFSGTRRDHEQQGGSSSARRARKSNKRSEGSSPQCASSTRSTTGAVSLSVATNQYNPCSDANVESPPASGFSPIPSTGPAAAAAPVSSAARPDRPRPRTVGSSSCRTIPNGNPRSSSLRRRGIPGRRRPARRRATPEATPTCRLPRSRPTRHHCLSRASASAARKRASSPSRSSRVPATRIEVNRRARQDAQRPPVLRAKGVRTRCLRGERVAIRLRWT
jgi:hypothetical protein